MVFAILTESFLLYFTIPLVLYYFYNVMFKNKYKLPPGPRSWPIIGSVPDPYSSPLSYKRLIEDWREKYGDIILFKRLGINFVYVNDYEEGYKAFTQTFSKELGGRPLNSVDRLSVGGDNIFFTKSLDPSWLKLRKHVMVILRKAAEPSKMAEMSNYAYDLFAKHIKEKKELVTENGFYVEPLMYWLGHNLLVQVFWQDAVEYSDPDYRDSIEMINKLMGRVADLALFDITPLNALPHRGKTEILKYSKLLSNKVQKYINQRRVDETYKTDPKFFIDYCLEIQDNQNEQNEKYANIPVFNNGYIANLCLDIYFAGMDAFGIGFTWTVGLLATHPQVQEKIRQELLQMKEKTGEEFTDKWIDHLHYLNAVINEVMRIHSLSSFTSYHRAMTDVKIGEYDIPKDTIVALNIYGVHHDKKYWKNPTEFSPERFLNDENEFQLPKEGYMPFGAGRRICIAERYTVKESHFIFTGRLCLDFQIVWSSRNEKKRVEEDMENTFFRHTAPFYVELVPIV